MGDVKSGILPISLPSAIDCTNQAGGQSERKKEPRTRREHRRDIFVARFVLSPLIFSLTIGIRAKGN